MASDEHLDAIAVKCRELLETSRDKYTEPAEAGWRATLSAIALIRSSPEVPECYFTPCIGTFLKQLGNEIRAAWPVEMLTK